MVDRARRGRTFAKPLDPVMMRRSAQDATHPPSCAWERG